MYWLGVHTAGSTITKGEMLMDWVSVESGLLNGATRLSPGRGVWEMTAKGEYKYTWYAYGIDDSGQIVYTVRVSGTATNEDCDTIKIQYTYEIFCPAAWPPQNVSGDPVFSTTGWAHEYRVPLTP